MLSRDKSGQLILFPAIVRPSFSTFPCACVRGWGGQVAYHLPGFIPIVGEIELLSYVYAAETLKAIKNHRKDILLRERQHIGYCRLLDVSCQVAGYTALRYPGQKLPAGVEPAFPY